MIFPLCIWSRELSFNNHWEVEMPPSLSWWEPPLSMLITRQCLAWLLLAAQRAFPRKARLALPNYWPGKEECGFRLPQTPGSRMECLNHIFCHLLCPLVPGDSYQCLVIVGEVSQQLPEKAATEDTRARTAARAHTHTLRNTFVASPKAALHFHPADSANSFLEIHSCSSVKPRRSKHLPNFLIWGLLHWDETSSSSVSIPIAPVSFKREKQRDKDNYCLLTLRIPKWQRINIDAYTLAQDFFFFFKPLHFLDPQHHSKHT